MTNRFLHLVILGAASAAVACSSSDQKACPIANDSGGIDLGAGGEPRSCRSDDDYHLSVSYHLSAARVITLHRLDILWGWTYERDAGEIISRLLAEDGTILHESRNSDPALCSGENCPPGPREVDEWEQIRLVPGAAFYELTDTVSGMPPIRIDLRGHVQLFCMNVACELDVCKPLPLDGGRVDASD
jgi:hypothetical protein